MDFNPKHIFEIKSRKRVFLRDFWYLWLFFFANCSFGQQEMIKPSEHLLRSGCFHVDIIKFGQLSSRHTYILDQFGKDSSGKTQERR